MFCPKCGLTINGSASKCPRCLAKIPQANQNITPQNSGNLSGSQNIPSSTGYPQQNSGFQQQGQPNTGFQQQGPQQNSGFQQQSQPNTAAYEQQNAPGSAGTQKNSTLANIALTFGIIGICGGTIEIVQYFTLILSILAIVFGAMARSKAKLTGEPTGAATAGMVLGIISIALTIISILVTGAIMYWIYSLFSAW
jgi:hypothetical protein